MLWFTINTLCRPFGRLAITTLELTTVAYIFCALGIVFLWKNKPMDVQCPVLIDCQTSLDDVLTEFMRGRGASSEYYDTPLEFISQDGWVISQLWNYYISILRTWKVVIERPKHKPIQRFSSVSFPMIPQNLVLLGIPVIITYCGILIAGWDLYFPSRIERLLWRVSSLGTLAVLIPALTFELAFPIFGKGSKPRSDCESLSQQTTQTERPDTGRRLCSQRNISKLLTDSAPAGHSSSVQNRNTNIKNNSSDRNPAFDVPFRSLVFITPLCATYGLFRAFMLIEDIISLRELPESAFVAVQWTSYFPHI